MADTQGIIKLQDFVDGWLWKAKLPRSEHRRIFHCAVDGVRELNILYATNTRKMVSLPLDGNFTVSFPDDFENFVGVGTMYRDKLYYLTRDEGIIDPELMDSVPTENDKLYSYAYGAKGGSNAKGYYRVDFDNRRILLSNTSLEEVILIYNSSGVSIDSDTYIPTIFKEALEAYIAYENVRYDFRVPENKVYRSEQNYNKAINKLHALTSSSLNEWYDVLLGLNTQSVIR